MHNVHCPSVRFIHKTGLWSMQLLTYADNVSLSFARRCRSNRSISPVCRADSSKPAAPLLEMADRHDYNCTGWHKSTPKIDRNAPNTFNDIIDIDFENVKLLLYFCSWLLMLVVRVSWKRYIYVYFTTKVVQSQLQIKNIKVTGQGQQVCTRT